jgi:hypothetical protein
MLVGRVVAAWVRLRRPAEPFLERKPMNIASNLALAAAVAVASLVCPARADLVYTFDADLEGWSSINDTSTFVWDGAIGNPGGAARGVDQAAGDIWYYAAPAGDLGPLGSLYGRRVSYEIRGITGNQTSIGALADVMIVGNGQRIGVNFAVQPVNGQWTAWSVAVDASAAWRVSATDGTLSGPNLTEGQIRAVLEDATGLFIRGEYTNGSDSTALDNVVIETGGCNDADFAAPFGTLDFFDVQAFLAAFSAHASAADLNGDGVFDFFDVQRFLTSFSAGCP